MPEASLAGVLERHARYALTDSPCMPTRPAVRSRVSGHIIAEVRDAQTDHPLVVSGLRCSRIDGHMNVGDEAIEAIHTVLCRAVAPVQSPTSLRAGVGAGPLTPHSEP